jgi:rod shape-determining protein MreD
MPWVNFFILLVAVLLTQTGVVSLLGWRSLDVFLIATLACGLWLPRGDARLRCWILGLAQDLASADTLGIHACALGLTGLLLTAMREWVNMNALTPRFVMLFLAAFAGQALYHAHLLFWASGGDGTLARWLTDSATTAALAAILTLVASAAAANVGARRRRGGRSSTFRRIARL